MVQRERERASESTLSHIRTATNQTDDEFSFFYAECKKLKFNTTIPERNTEMRWKQNQTKQISSNNGKIPDRRQISRVTRNMLIQPTEIEIRILWDPIIIDRQA